jgi:hypothetical protein
MANTFFLPISSRSDYPYVCFSVRVMGNLPGEVIWGSEGRVDRVEFAVVPQYWNGRVNFTNFFLPNYIYDNGYPGSQYLYPSQFPVNIPYGYKIVYRFLYVRAQGPMGCMGNPPFAWDYLVSPTFEVGY